MHPILYYGIINNIKMYEVQVIAWPGLYSFNFDKIL